MVQAQGEWTEEEHEAFVATAREHGVGDKWGLFASYLPQRVGYQCSAYYRCGSSKSAGQTVRGVLCCVEQLCSLVDASCFALSAHCVPNKLYLGVGVRPLGVECREVIIPQGLVIDKRFRMSRGGKATYVG